jgi:hypothetical protein
VVDDDESLLRRVHPNHVGADGRLLWLAFKGRELSVDREALRSVPEAKRLFPGRTVARLRCGDCRGIGFEVREDPIPVNAAHALLISPARSHGEERRLAMLLRDSAEWPV